MIGRMDTKVAFQRKQAARDRFGNERGQFSTLFEAWAEVQESLGREVLNAGRMGEQATARMIVWRSEQSLGLTTEDAVLCRGQMWNIRSIAPIERDHQRMELLIERGAAQ